MRLPSTCKGSFIFCFAFLTAVISSCNNQPPSKIIPAGHAKLVKTIGNPRYGNVQCGMQDKAGNLWFGTTQNGVYKYDGKYFRQYLEADGLNSNSVYCLLEDTHGKIWLGTEGGICIYDPSDSAVGKTFTQINIPLPSNLSPNKNPNYLNSHWVYSMMQAKDGKIWFVTIDGIYIYDGTSFTRFKLNARYGFLTDNDEAERILQDKDGNTWFGARTNEGVYKYDGKSIINLPLTALFQDGPRPKPHKWGWPQLQDRNGNIWFSNWGGAYKYDGKTFTGFSKKDGLPGNIAKIIEDRNGNIWFGGSGICRYDGKSFTCYTAENGIPIPGVWSILEDKAGNIWVGTRETSLYLFDGTKLLLYSEYRKQPATDTQHLQRPKKS